MKRYGYLWQDVTDFGNLLAAARQAQRGKRFRDNILRFNYDLEHHLIQLQQELQTQTYEDYLATLRLKIHPIKSQLFETRLGPVFVGFRVLPDHIRVKSANLHRARYRLRQYQKQYASGNLSFEQLTQSVRSWAAHLKHADTWHLRGDIFSALMFSKSPP